MLGIVHSLIDNTELASKSSTFLHLLSVLTLKSISTLLLHLPTVVAVPVVSSVSVPLLLPRKRKVEMRRMKSKLHYCHCICIYHMPLTFTPSCIQRLNVELICPYHNASVSLVAICENPVLAYLSCNEASVFLLSCCRLTLQFDWEEDPGLFSFIQMLKTCAA